MNTKLSEIFYELKVYPSDFRELFLDLVFSLGVECIEENDECFIIRDENNLDEIEFGLNEYAKSLRNALGREIKLKIEKIVFFKGSPVVQYEKTLESQDIKLLKLKEIPKRILSLVCCMIEILSSEGNN